MDLANVVVDTPDPAGGGDPAWTVPADPPGSGSWLPPARAGGDRP